ncbi:hypothetical protein QBC41DRAFT_156353 [Cercophora samala]|uniref:Transmembrane protein n=1 Tax=Cercophora samala TaxID=330535 RepID=A0AA39Z8A4_9PEZI|nr:hypothetical protein QBC41DRAFT_156353 [Cercophora samala]
MHARNLDTLYCSTRSSTHNQPTPHYLYKTNQFFYICQTTFFVIYKPHFLLFVVLYTSFLRYGDWGTWGGKKKNLEPFYYRVVVSIFILFLELLFCVQRIEDGGEVFKFGVIFLRLLLPRHCFSCFYQGKKKDS